MSRRSPVPAAVALRPMALSDIRRVVGLQREVLPESAITQLGARFLEGFYRAALASQRCEAILACDADARIAGVALATADAGAFNAAVTPKIVPRLAAALAVRWPLACRFLRRPFERTPARDIPAELLLLFVDASAQRSGTGTGLLDAVEHSFRQAGIAEYRVSVRSELHGPLAFYAARGFELEGQHTVLGRPMTYLTKRLDRP